MHGWRRVTYWTIWSVFVWIATDWTIQWMLHCFCSYHFNFRITTIQGNCLSFCTWKERAHIELNDENNDKGLKQKQKNKKNEKKMKWNKYNRENFSHMQNAKRSIFTLVNSFYPPSWLSECDVGIINFLHKQLKI